MFSLKNTQNSDHNKIIIAAMWILRVVVGAVFIFSGFTKIVDIWGFVFKINDYLAAWNIDFINHGTLVIAAFSISTFEFTCGVMLALGVMRRAVPRLLLVLMAFLLPLTLYIAIAEPVADCGCFGDALVISNTATFIKNLILTFAIIILVKYNVRAGHPFLPVMQWAVVVCSVIYCAVIAVIGYSVQPLVDFRPYPVGEPLIDYSRPDKSLTIFDGDEDVTDQVIENSDSLLLLIIPDLDRHGMARSAQTNAIFRLARLNNTKMAALVATDDSTARAWSRRVGAEYPVFTAEDTQLKELARGDAALVYVTSDTVRWKRSLYSLNSTEPNANSHISSYSPIENSNILIWLTLIYIALLIVVYSMRFTTRKKF